MRTQSASELAQPIIRALREGRLAQIASLCIDADSGFRWSVRRPPQPAGVALSAAFDGSRRCLARTDEGMFLYDGDRSSAPILARGLPGASTAHSISSKRIGDGRWLVGGDRATFAVCGTSGVEDVVKGSDEAVRFELFSGDLGDLGILVGTRDGGVPALYALVGRHWLKPLPLQDAPALAGIARVDATRWMLAGKVAGDRPFCALYAPLGWDVARLATEGRAPLVAVAGDVLRRTGLAVALDGTRSSSATASPRSSASSKARASASPTSTRSAASGWAVPGGFWMRAPHEIAFRCVFEADDDKPFVALSSEGETVLALTSDFVIVKGRAEATKKGIGMTPPP